MRTIIRNNYTPKIGDYHDMIVHDETLGKIWLFDCDGVYLDMSKTNVRVVDEAGESVEYAISQRFATDGINGANERITNVDEGSQRRDGELEAGLTAETEARIAAVSGATSEAIVRENAIKTDLNGKIDATVDDIETLTRSLNTLNNLVTRIESTAVFDVTLTQGQDDVALTVTDGTQQKSVVFREANSEQNGLMSVAAYEQIQQNSDAIQHLQNAGLYRGSFEYLTDAPTTTPDPAFIGGEVFNNDYISVQKATEGGETGIARYRIVLNGSNITYGFEAFIDKDIKDFTNSSAGLIKGSTTDGNVSANADGTGTVSGWSTLSQSVTDNANNISTVAGDVSGLSTRLGTDENNISTNTGNISTLQGNVSDLTSRVGTAEGNITSNANSITTLNNKPVEGTSDTTLSANTEKLLTVQGMMNHWVDITQSGLPANPDANTFYYTVEASS